MSIASLEEGNSNDPLISTPSTSGSVLVSRPATAAITLANLTISPTQSITTQSSMHSFGVTNGSTEEQPSSSPTNGVFTNGDVQNGDTSNGNASGNMSNGTESSGINNYTNGSNEDESELDNIDSPYMNGNSHKVPKKETKFSPQTSHDFDIIRLIGQQLCIMGLE